MIPFLIFSGILVGAISIAIILGLRRAVDGYEDETGFHKGVIPVTQHKPAVRPRRTRVARSRR